MLRIKKIWLFFSLGMWISSLWAIVDGTTGTPLGGLGTGAVKFRAGQGTFTFTDQTPTRYENYQNLPGAQFMVYTQRNGQVISVQKLKASRKEGKILDDAVFPVHTVQFDSINEIEIQLRAFCPFNPSSPDLMAIPCAFYEFTCFNFGTSPADMAIAFQLTTSSIPELFLGKGFADLQSLHQKCVFAKGEEDSVIITAGALGSFLSTGKCENQVSGKTNGTAVLVHLLPQEKATFLFVFAWYNKTDPDRYYYTNFYANAVEVAEAGIQRASQYKEKAFALVSRMRSSNLPEWLVDHTLVTLVNWVNNSIYTKDGRYCHNEGMYFMNGTMDQMWHARQVNIQFMPEIAWKELEYWARCQKASGQIHHDFGSTGDYPLVPWDLTEYADYRNIDKWVDLNCGFIISVYEAYIATGDQTKLAFFWPYVKKAGQRILDQLALYGDPQYPYTFLTSESTYDAGGDSQAFNTGLSIVAYRLLSFLAKACNEPDLALQYEQAFQNAVQGFSNKWLKQPVSTGIYCESMMGGPWIANFLKLGQFWPSHELDNLFFTLVNYYDPITQGLGYPGGSYSEFQTYLVSHLGGFALQTGRVEIWQALQTDMYERNMLNRNLVYNQQLGIPPKVTTPIYEATNSSGSDQYISIPVLWRNYYTVVGFHRNRVTHELWLEPICLPEMNHRMENAFVICPEGHITLNAVESGEAFQNQRITVESDQAFHVDSLYIKDKYGDRIYSIRINGQETPFVRTGTGYQKWVKLYWSGEMGPQGVTIEAEGEPVIPQIPASPSELRGHSVSPSEIRLTWKDNASNEAGFIIESLIRGRFVQIGTVSANETTFSHTGLLENKEYVYRVCAYNNDGYSEYSPEARAFTQTLQQGPVVIAVNAGGPAYTGKDGISYVSDINAGFCHGGQTYQTQTPISGTQDDPLYQSERFGEFEYHFPVEPGQYQITFKFAEIYFSDPRRRVFHVRVENALVIQNLDIFLLGGNFSAYDVHVPIQVQDGTLDILMVPGIENPKLSALVVRKIAPQAVGERILSLKFDLLQNYPNPFNATTTIAFDLPKTEKVTLKIYNLEGQIVEILKDESMEAGHHRISWNAGQYPSGVYFCQLETPGFVKIRKMILLR